MAEIVFDTELWEWDGEGAWFFVTMPEDDTEHVRMVAGPPRGFGSVRVEATVGATTWRTSVFPDKRSGCFLLPVKQAVRRAEGIGAGDVVHVEIDVVG